VPRQDSFGRWISDDGLFYWDGNAWRAVAPQATARRGVSVAQPLLIGAGFVVLVVVVVVVGLVVLFQNPVMQQSFCNGWQSGQKNSDNTLACPFHPSP
jgi:hypothetical protein